jgi:hypothetical protein
MVNSINYGAQDSLESIDSKFGLSDDSHPISPTKMVISRVLELQLEHSRCHWKVKSNIYKIIFHKNWLILKVVHSSAYIVQLSALVPIGCGNFIFEWDRAHLNCD